MKVTIPDYGSTSTTPVYQDLFKALETAGYDDSNLVVAGYNFRLSPDLGGFLSRTKRLIVGTFQENGGQPIRLVGHSNGPIYAQYLLNNVSPKWKRRYIQGFTNIAGNLPGQGLLWSYLFTGVNVSEVFALPTDSDNARSSARLMAMSPSTWMSISDPKIFKRSETVVRDLSTGRSYTPANTSRLLRDAGFGGAATQLANQYIGFVPFTSKRNFPNVDVTAEKGSGLPTPVGIVLPDLSLGQVVDAADPPYLNKMGDSNEENLTTNAVKVWHHMKCYRFRQNVNPGVTHLGLTSDPEVIARLLADLKRSRKNCS